MFGTASGLFQNHMQPIIEETFCKPAGFPFKQIIPSCSPLRSPMLLPWKFPCVPRLFSSPEECKVFLFKQKFAAWSWANKQHLLHRIPCFFLAHYSWCTFLPEKYFLEKGERLANTKTVGVPAFTKYLSCCNTCSNVCSGSTSYISSLSSSSK